MIIIVIVKVIVIANSKPSNTNHSRQNTGIFLIFWMRGMAREEKLRMPLELEEGLTPTSIAGIPA